MNAVLHGEVRRLFEALQANAGRLDALGTKSLVDGAFVAFERGHPEVLLQLSVLASRLFSDPLGRAVWFLIHAARGCIICGTELERRGEERLAFDRCRAAASILADERLLPL